MATDPGTLDLLFDQLGSRAARYSARRMFGEYCLYRDGNPVALVCDDVLFVKDTADGIAAVAAAMAPEHGPPYPGARPHLRIPADRWDDGDWLVDVLERTAAALPPPKPRKAKPAQAVGDGATRPTARSRGPSGTTKAANVAKAGPTRQDAKRTSGGRTRPPKAD